MKKLSMKLYVQELVNGGDLNSTVPSNNTKLEVLSSKKGRKIMYMTILISLQMNSRLGKTLNTNYINVVYHKNYRGSIERNKSKKRIKRRGRRRGILIKILDCKSGAS